METTSYYQQIYWDVERDMTERRRLDSRATRRLHDVVLRHLESAEKILDIGCGAGGVYAPGLLRSARHVAGIDLAPLALRHARAKGIAAAAADLQQRLPFADASFDGILANEVLEHLFAPHEAVREMARLLKPNGVVVLSVPNIAHFPNRLRMLGGKFVGGGLPATANEPWRDPHIRFFTPDSLRRMVDANGFEVTHEYGNGAAVLREFPGVSRVLRRAAGKERLRQLSDPLEPLGYVWPSLLAGRIMLAARKR